MRDRTSEEAIVAILTLAIVTLIRTLLLWFMWDWFGYQVLNDAIPTLHAQAIDGWAALGLGTLGTAFTAQTDYKSKK